MREVWAPEIYACEDKDALQQVLGQQYHAVVGNPTLHHGEGFWSLNALLSGSLCYVPSDSISLAVPFAERFFELAVTSKNGRCGYLGMITANSFMKREFGKKLIEEYIPGAT